MIRTKSESHPRLVSAMRAVSQENSKCGIVTQHNISRKYRFFEDSCSLQPIFLGDLTANLPKLLLKLETLRFLTTDFTEFSRIKSQFNITSSVPRHDKKQTVFMYFLSVRIRAIRGSHRVLRVVAMGGFIEVMQGFRERPESRTRESAFRRVRCGRRSVLRNRDRAGAEWWRASPGC